MLISGFTFARNTEKLGYPTVESIRSILPVCDEFIIALGKGDDDDTTREKIAAIGDPRIKIIDTEWTDLDRLKSRIYSQQTNLAASHCRGTWGFYLQCDEVIHEQYLPVIRSACDHFAENNSVDGFLFRYKHFWGDYDHYFTSHAWYPREIRIIRTGRDIVSVGDAQSFRYSNGRKVPVVEIDAEVFHYGHVRDPRLVHIRRTSQKRIYKGTAAAAHEEPVRFDYGSLKNLPVYKGTYPSVMTERIAAVGWKDLLDYTGTSKTRHKHRRLKYRFLTFIEQVILRGSGREFWGYKPYRILRDLSCRYRKLSLSQPAHGPAASVIIAVYNKPDFLEKVFHSLQRQTFSNFEIVIADDGSGPETARMIDRYRNAFVHPTHHVRHEDDGFRKTIIVNKAVVASHASYCIFIDGDSILHHRFIEFHMKRRRRGRVLSGRRVMMNEKLSTSVTLDDIDAGRIEHPSFWMGNCKRAGKKHGYFIPGAFHVKNLLPRKSNDILGANFSVYKDDFIYINGYDERIIGRGLEDDNLSIRFHLAGIPVKTMGHEALQYHLFHRSSPIPHDSAFVDRFRNNPGSARTPFGIVKGES